MTRLTMRRALLVILPAVASLWVSPLSAAPLTLKECLTRAAEANPELKARSYDESIATENITLATSAFWPRLDMQGGYTSQLEPQSIQVSPGQAFATQDANYGFFSFAANYTLYDFGRRSSRSSQAELLKDATSDQFRGREQDIFLQTVKGYYGTLQTRKLLEAAEDEEKNMTDHVRVAQALYDQGVVTRNDLLQATVRLAASKQRKLSAQNEVEKAWLVLNYLTGQPDDYRAELDETTQYLDEIPASDNGSDVTGRHEYQAQIKTVQADDQDVRESRQAFYPELFLKAGVDYIQNSMVTEQAIFAATVGLRFNIFEGNATMGKHRQAVARRSRDEAALKDLEARLRLELATSRRDARVARERIGVTEQAIQQAEENLRINNNRYVEKVGTATEVLDAQTLLTQTRVDFATAQYDYQVALARLRRARGEL